MALQIPTVTVDDLRAFHAKHFPNASTPEQYLHGIETEAHEEIYDEDDDGLGYYPDGTKRTLTDEQIAMFRHSEIQTIIRERRRQRDNGDASEDGEAAPTPPAVNSNSTPIEPVTSGIATPAALATTSANTDKVQSGRIEKPKGQQWATSSTRTKTRNKKHRDNYKLKKKAERDKREQKRSNRQQGEGGDESDEWDPWHQANGPDVQKDDTVALDY